MIRKYILIIFVFFLSGCCARGYQLHENAGTKFVTIASFNIRIFSNNSRNDEEIEYIADVLKRYDIIAIQELRDEEVLKRTTAVLRNKGVEYDYQISGKVGRGVKERYAFLYKKSKVRVLNKGKLYQEKDDEFIREPFYATFKAGKFDFTLVTLHILYGKNKAERRREIKKVAVVYKEIQDEDPNEQDIIVLGDFNFSPTDEGWDNLKEISTMYFLIEPPEKTTITDTSLFDNFWFQNEYVQEYSGKLGIDRFDETMFGNDDAKAKLMVSDHRPIWAEFNVMTDDDGLTNRGLVKRGKIRY